MSGECAPCDILSLKEIVMKNRFQKRKALLSLSAVIIRAVVATLMLLLASCASQATKDAEVAVVEAERAAVEQEAGQVAEDQKRARAAAERVKATEEREREVAEARGRAAAETSCCPGGLARHLGRAPSHRRFAVRPTRGPRR